MGINDLLNIVDDVDIEYEYQPVNYQPAHPVIHPSTNRSFLKDESCKSNVLGADNDYTVKMLCYDAEDVIQR